jgi:HAE1 family hydrophobic/amphiphilic exporter-1
LVIVVVFLPIANGISFKYHYTVLCYGNYLHFILLTGVIYDNSLVVSRFGNWNILKVKNFGRYSWFEKILTRFTIDYQFIKMVFRSLQTTLAVVLVLFFSSIALVPFGFIGGEFLPNQIVENFWFK